MSSKVIESSDFFPDGGETALSYWVNSYTYHIVSNRRILSMDFLPDSFVLDTEKINGYKEQKLALELKISDEENSIDVKQTVNIKWDYVTQIQGLSLPELTLYSKFTGRLTYSKKFTTGNALQFKISYSSSPET